ncbi:MAG: hypothetical protein U1C46_04825 [Bacteroidales bacterium]|nr:hypothetical protein [Bacteroidales bacterium]MDZ4204124.1 hypothetical protein [Bacteroidales bacterium]
MKKLTITLLALFLSIGVFAQDPLFLKDDKVINLGVGIGSGLVGYGLSVPPVSASFELGVADGIFDKASIGIGGYLGFASYSYKHSDWRYTDFILGARGSIHYPLVEKLDTYASLMLGFRVRNWNYDYDGTNYNRPVSAWILGGRYYLTDNLALMGEVGYGIAYLTVGVALKL